MHLVRAIETCLASCEYDFHRLFCRYALGAGN
jgi:hypothetical protein